MIQEQPPAKILIIDDHPTVREGLAMRIGTQFDMQVCGEGATEDEALLLVRETNPDLVIVDITLKAGHGLEVIKRVKADHPHVKMLVFSGHQESLFANRALRAGALGYLNKQDSNDQVLEAIRTVLAGKQYVSAQNSQPPAHPALGDEDASKSPGERLTERELEIFRMIGEGQKNRAIAQKLFLSLHTIDSHRENIKRKLKLKNSAELARDAVHWLLENS